MSLLITLDNLKKAKSAKTVFGPLLGTKKEQLKQLKSVFRQLAKATHEDLYPKEEKNKAKEAFQELNRWHKIAMTQIQNGDYGVENPITITFRKNTYILSKKIKNGDLAEIYLCGAEKEPATKILKLAKSPSVNALLKIEAKTLLQISRFDGRFKKLVENHIQKFENSFEINGRQGNFLELNNGFFTLEEVIAAHPNGIDSKVMAWIFRRLLASLIGVHEAGYVHGAVNPSHFMINLEDHNGRLIDFCYSVKSGETITHITPNYYKKLYPPEVFNKQKVGPETDIYMAAKTMELLVDTAKLPRSIKYFLKSLRIDNQMRRPNNCLDIFHEFAEIIESLWGPPKWVDLKMPVNS